MKFLITFFLTFSVLYSQTPFSPDSALAYLKTLSVTIGPRPMGSPGERKALEFGLSKFREFGLDDAYIMEMSSVEKAMSQSSTNTHSGITVGILRGKTDRIILIGGHLDSAGPDIPGANDNGSGAASVIELARILSKEEHHSTIVFCLFGGEEVGLCGSRYFVQYFPYVNDIALMLNLDMTNGTETLIPTIDSEDGNTPIWLVQAAYEEIGRLGYSGLEYPTHFFTAMSMLPGGGVSSDHKPFLERNIPAIDFTSDIDDPIHTPQDDFEHFKPAGFKRSGDLVYALIHRFDENIPSQKTDKYFLYQIGSRALFFPLWLLTAFIILTVILSIYALIRVRTRRIETDKGHKPRIPALKLFLLALLIQACVWLSENLVGLIKGIRFPWISNPEGYFILAFLAALIGIIISLKLSPRMKLSKDPYRWFLRTVIFLLAFILLFSFTNVKATLYPSLALFFLTLAILIHKPWLKLLLWVISPHFMFRLMFSEGFVFMARGMAFSSTHAIWMYLALHIFYILFFALWSFPFLLGFAAVYYDNNELRLLRPLQSRTGSIVVTAIFVICVIILTFLPSYSDIWRQKIVIEQSVDLNTGKGKIVLRSAEYLKNLNINIDGKDTAISSWDREILLKKLNSDQEPWIRVERTIKTYSDSGTTFDILAKISFKHRPEKFTLSYVSAKNIMENISIPFSYGYTDHSINMRWESLVDTSFVIPVRFKINKGDSVTETIEARFPEMIEPVQIKKELTNISPRTILNRSEIIRGKLSGLLE